MCATRFIVYMFSIGSLILNRLPAFGVISPLLCLGHSLTKIEKEKRRAGEGKSGCGGEEEKKTDRKIQLKRREEKKNGSAASGHIFTPLTRRDDCCFAPSLLPFTSPDVFLIHLHVKAVEATVQISMR